MKCSHIVCILFLRQLLDQASSFLHFYSTPLVVLTRTPYMVSSLDIQHLARNCEPIKSSVLLPRMYSVVIGTHSITGIIIIVSVLVVVIFGVQGSRLYCLKLSMHLALDWILKVERTGVTGNFIARKYYRSVHI